MYISINYKTINHCLLTLKISILKVIEKQIEDRINTQRSRQKLKV